MPNNYESTVVRDNYEVSIWNDVYDTSAKRFTEEKIAVIGSNTMTAQTRILDPTLTENTNGTKTLTFNIYYRYIDHLDGIEKINPFIKLLIVERKIKLHWKDEWYDFIIKNRVEASEKHSFIYTCESLAANELTKTGYHLEFDTELANNTDTIWNLATTVLEGTDWRINESAGKNFRETIAESGYTLGILNNSGNATTINSYNTFLVFYNTIFTTQNKPNNSGTTMFQAWLGDLNDVDDKGILRTGTCLTDSAATYSKTNSSISFTFNYNSNTYKCNYNTSQQIYQYRAKRDVLQQLTIYSPPLKRYVGRYKQGNTDILGYTTAEYIAPDTVTNLIINDKNFVNTDGWFNADSFTIWPVYDANTVVSDYHPKGYLLDKRRYLGNNCLLHNTQYLPDGLPKNTKLIVKLNLKKAHYDNGYTIDTTELPSQVTALIREYTYDSSTNIYTPSGTNYGETTLSGSNGELSGTLTITTTLTKNDILSKNLALFFNFGSSTAADEAYAIESAEFYLRKTDAAGNILTPNSIDSTSVITYTSKYFSPSDNTILNTEDKINWLYVGTSHDNEESSKWGSATPVYDTSCEKIRTITGKNSTRYNWLQTLAETFEVWCKFWVEHNADGTIAYETINNVEVPKKYVTFVERVGTFANYGFVYGIDLRSIQRTIDSSALATKIIVPQNSNEFATDGFCTIQRSNENYSKENYIINFDYYCDNGLIDRGRFYTDLYEPYDSSTYDTTGNLGYYQRLNQLNTEYDTRAEQIVALKNDLDKQQSYLTTYTTLRDSANSEINSLKSQIMTLIADNSNSQVTGYSEAKVQAFMAAKPKWETLITLYATLTQTQEAVETYTYIIGNNSRGLTKSVADIIDQLENETTGLYKLQEENREAREAVIADFNKRYSRYVQEGTWTSEDYTDDTKYYLDAKAVAYTSSRPKLTYNIQVIRLSALADFKAKQFKLGDISWVEDEEFFMARYREEVVVTQVVSHLDSPENDTITVQNYRTEFQDLFQRAESTIHSFQYGEGSYERAASIVNTDGTINITTLENSIANNNFLMNQSGLRNSITTGPDGITVTDLTNIANKVRITANGLFITTDGGNNWVNAIKGTGVSTESLTAGIISTKDIIIDGGQGNTFRWDSDGISAYYFDSANTIVDTSHFIRLDRFGIYGIIGINNFSPTTEEQVFNNASFGMTWDRFFMKNRYGTHYVEISSTNDIRVVDTSSGTDIEQIKIGELASPIYDSNNQIVTPGIYGLRISDANANTVMETNTSGELWLKNILHVGTTGNTYVAHIGYLPLITIEGNQIIWTVGGSSTNLDTRHIDPNDVTSPTIHRTVDINSNFVVWEDGTIYARDGYFEGTINATDGYFSGAIVATEGYIGNLTIGEVEALPGRIDNLDDQVDQLKGIEIESQEGTDFITTDDGTTPSAIHLTAVANGFEAVASNYTWAKSSDLSTWTTLSSGDGAVGASYTATYSTLPYFPYYIKLQYSNEYTTYETLNEIQSGESPLMLEIHSSTGTLFVNRNISTTLTATVWKGTENVTSQYNGQFYWYKDGDAFAPSNHTNAVTVSDGDVNQKAVFVCTIGEAT